MHKELLNRQNWRLHTEEFLCYCKFYNKNKLKISFCIIKSSNSLTKAFRRICHTDRPKIKLHLEFSGSYFFAEILKIRQHLRLKRTNVLVVWAEILVIYN